MRAHRRALSLAQREQAAQRMFVQLARYSHFSSYKNIAVYLANDGELSPHCFVDACWRQRRHVFLPIVQSRAFQRMRFARYGKNSVMRKNRYNIPEPVQSSRKLKPGLKMDLLLMPLVAFDSQGNRLGMGGGYYDRTFAYLRQRRHWCKPVLLGVAYDFQQVDALPVESWDVPLDGIVTESRLIWFKNR